MSSFSHGTAKVGTSPVLVCTVTTERNSLHVQNYGEEAVFIGGPDVEAEGARRGFRVDPGASLRMSTSESDAVDLYAVTASDSTWIAFLT